VCLHRVVPVHIASHSCIPCGMAALQQQQQHGDPRHQKRDGSGWLSWSVSGQVLSRCPLQACFVASTRCMARLYLCALRSLPQELRRTGYKPQGTV
jgi:hypothetical protein